MKNNPSPTEYEECKTFVAWLELNNLRFSHLAQTNVNPNVRFKNHNLGVRRGVPDYMVVTPHGLVFIEMKRLKGSKTYPEQIEWRDALNELDGVEAHVCRGADEAIEVVK